jgi:RNA polymerase-binding transcription factor DksA
VSPATGAEAHWNVPDPRQRLLDELAGKAAELARLELDHARLVAAAEASNADDEHDPEGATLAFEREQLTAMLTRTRAARAELARALGRLDGGTYGRCERCGRPIDAERLEARPHARTCIDCARAASPARRR